MITEGINVGFVIFTGAETRVALNHKPGETHKGKLDRQADRWIINCFLFIMILAVFLGTMAHFPTKLNNLVHGGGLRSSAAQSLNSYYNVFSYDEDRLVPDDRLYQRATVANSKKAGDVEADVDVAPETLPSKRSDFPHIV